MEVPPSHRPETVTRRIDPICAPPLRNAEGTPAAPNGGSGSFYGPTLTRQTAYSTIRRMPNRLSTGRRGPVSDAEMVTLVTAHGGRAVPGWRDQIRPYSPGRVTGRLPGGDLAGFVNVAWDGGDLSSSARVAARQRILLLRHRFAQDRLVDREDVA
jgi:hypothetical protein